MTSLPGSKWDPLSLFWTTGCEGERMWVFPFWDPPRAHHRSVLLRLSPLCFQLMHETRGDREAFSGDGHESRASQASHPTCSTFPAACLHMDPGRIRTFSTNEGYWGSSNLICRTVIRD